MTKEIKATLKEPFELLIWDGHDLNQLRDFLNRLDSGSYDDEVFSVSMRPGDITAEMQNFGDGDKCLSHYNHLVSSPYYGIEALSREEFHTKFAVTEGVMRIETTGLLDPFAHLDLTDREMSKEEAAEFWEQLPAVAGYDYGHILPLIHQCLFDVNGNEEAIQRKFGAGHWVRSGEVCGPWEDVSCDLTHYRYRKGDSGCMFLPRKPADSRLDSWVSGTPSIIYKGTVGDLPDRDDKEEEPWEFDGTNARVYEAPESPDDLRAMAGYDYNADFDGMKNLFKKADEEDSAEIGFNRKHESFQDGLWMICSGSKAQVAQRLSESCLYREKKNNPNLYASLRDLLPARPNTGVRSGHLQRGDKAIFLGNVGQAGAEELAKAYMNQFPEDEELTWETFKPVPGDSYTVKYLHKLLTSAFPPTDPKRYSLDELEAFDTKLERKFRETLVTTAGWFDPGATEPNLSKTRVYDDLTDTVEAR